MGMRFSHWVVASVVAGLAVMAGMPWIDGQVVRQADAKGAPSGKQAITSPSLDALNEAPLADRLAAIGDRTKDSLLLIAAAKIKQRIGEADVTRKPAGEKDAAAADRKGGALRTDVAAILARARDYAGGRKDLVALAEDVAKSGVRGRVGGVSRTEHIIRGGGEYSVIHQFQGGEPAGVAIRGDGDTDLDLFVYDSNGKRLCAQEGVTDEEICRWRPAETAEYRIIIRNLGGVSNSYRLWTN